MILTSHGRFRLIFNLVDCSESFKSAESWTPICLPKFDSDGFLHAHVSYLADDCQACLLLLSVEKDVFFTLSDAKQKITEVRIILTSFNIHTNKNTFDK